MSHIIIDCPHCSEETRVAMDQNLTQQQCEKCGQYLYGADTAVRAGIASRGKERSKRLRNATTTAAEELRGQTVDDTDAFQRRGIQRWYFPMAVIALTLVVGLIWWLVSRAKKELGVDKEPELVLQKSLQKDPTPQVPPSPTKGAVAAGAPSEAWATTAHEISEKFLKATTVEEILPLVRNLPAHEKSIRAFAAGGNLPIAKAGAMDILYAPQDGATAGTLAMLFFQNRLDKMQGLVLAETSTGLKVDWPSFSGEGEMSMKEFLATRPTEPVLLRVAGRKDDYFSFDFDNREQYSCLRLTDYPETMTLFGYIPKGSPMEKKVAHLATQNNAVPEDQQIKPQPLTVRVRFHLGSKSPNQVEILEILGNGWYVP